MYKLSVPVCINTITDENIAVWLDILRSCKAERIFICLAADVCTDISILYNDPQKLRNTIAFFKKHGFETGFWINSLGHGGALLHDTAGTENATFTQMAGVLGDVSGHAYCPLDKNFKKKYSDAIKLLAAFAPDIIMIDDDFRLNLRSYYMGCFCELHLEEYYKRIGERIPREKLEKYIFTGGRNRYRSEYMKLSADTLLDFSASLRKAVDEVDPNIRLGVCACYDNWDYVGTDLIEISKVLAGKTKPFLRTIGAPYWNNNIIEVVENTRMQAQWCKNTGIELFAEGDTYPRPRYNVPSRVLELFDMALISDGSTDGILKYMFHYNHKPEYETGYFERHIKNSKVRDALKEMFEGKKPVGIRAYNVMHTIESAVLPEKCPEKIATKLIASYKSVSCALLSGNSIPTSHTDDGEYPVLVCGENARYISEKELENGAILDAAAAVILNERGIDTGILSCEKADFSAEYFYCGGESVPAVNNNALCRISCKEDADIKSIFVPENSPASYFYENSRGQRFFVLACDMKFSEENANYTNNYYRQSDLVQACERLCGKKLPVVSLKNPNLYILASRSGDKMSVAMFNISLDEISLPDILLDKKYSDIRFINCTGKLCGDTVKLSEIGPYGFAAFEVG